MDRYVLIGSPIAHSLSPRMMNLSFSALGIDASYGLCEADEAALPETVDRLVRDDVRGWNVTMPCKHAMSLICDELSLAAQLGGAVNTVLQKDGKLSGYTTDGEGFIRALAGRGLSVKEQKLVLLGGGGGAARSILIQCALDGAAEIVVFCHRASSESGIRELAEKLQPHSGTRIRTASYDDAQLSREMADAAVLINATNIGMAGTTSSGKSLIHDAGMLPDGIFIYDIIYHPAETPLLVQAAGRNLPYENGLSMLIGQGAAAFSIWTGCEMPVDLVRESLTV